MGVDTAIWVDLSSKIYVLFPVLSLLVLLICIILEHLTTKQEHFEKYFSLVNTEDYLFLPASPALRLMKKRHSSDHGLKLQVYGTYY